MDKIITQQELVNACWQLLQTFSQQPAVIEDSAEKVLVVGDVHGDFETITYVKSQLPNYERIVFVGDYVDRGNNDLEVICALPELAQNQKVVFLAGNHDADSHTMPREFRARLDTFGGPAAQVAEALCVAAFNIAPIAYYNLKHKMLAVHGGIPHQKDEACVNFRQLWDKPLRDGKSAMILWNDFAFAKVPTTESRRAPDAFVVGDADAEAFMKINGLNIIIRGHQSDYFNTIYPVGNDGCIVTVGSASAYKGNRAVFKLPEKEFIQF